MANLLRAEWIKLRKSTSFWVLACTAAALTALIFFLFNSYVEELKEAGVAEELMEAGVAIAATGIVNFYQALHQTQINAMLVGILSAVFICAEFEKRTIGISLFSGFSRNKLMIAKIALLFFGTVILTAIMPLLMLISCAIANGLGGSVSELAAPMLRDFGLYILGNLALAAFCALLAYALRNVGGAIGACIGTTFVLSLLPSFQIGGMERVAKFSFMTQLTYIGMDDIDLPFYLGVMAVTIGGALGAAALVFKKSELK